MTDTAARDAFAAAWAAAWASAGQPEHAYPSGLLYWWVRSEAQARLDRRLVAVEHP